MLDLFLYCIMEMNLDILLDKIKLNFDFQKNLNSETT
jgi:hypothetical protein